MTDFSTAGYLTMDLLRFTTAGSVDDGKSTLIGRLLYDSKSIFEEYSPPNYEHPHLIRIFSNVAVEGHGALL